MGQISGHLSDEPKKNRVGDENAVGSGYLEKIKERMGESRVYRDFQMIGLEVAEILDDTAHKALYIKLAKRVGGEAMLGLAKDVAQRQGIKNKGAYFMKLLSESKPLENKK